MIKLLKRLNKKDILFAIICFIFVVFQVYLDLKIPDFMNKISSLIVNSKDSTLEILIQGDYMLLCALLSLISSVIVGYFASKIAASFSKKLRSEIFNKVEEFSMEEIKKFSTSSLITRTTNDVNQVQVIISMGLQIIMKAPIMAVWAILKILGKSPEWSIATLVAVIVLIIVISIIMILALPRFKIIQNLTDDLNNVTRENLTGIRVVRAYNAEKYQEDKFNKSNKKLTNTHLFVSKVMAIMNPCMSLIMTMLSLSIYIIGAYLIDAAGMLDRVGLFSDMVVFTSYSMQVVSSFMMLIIIFIIYPRASVSAKRILEVLNTEPKIKEGNISNSKEIGTIEFKDVSFQYPDAEEPSLSNINFKINKGEFVAFIGSTGCGKSTLINLIPRFYDVTSGEVLVDGVNVKNYKLEYLNNKLGYISQKAVLFNGTILSNITYGKSSKKITKDKVKESIEVAQASDFVDNMTDGYDSHISQGGTNVSGGQKQRLAIARAIARDPEIYIFDDSFSALDYKTDSNLRKDLRKYTKDATVLIVAQRIGTIKNADKIIVLENGKMVGIGTHKELLKNCSVYNEIALSQLSKEELENA